MRLSLLVWLFALPSMALDNALLPIDLPEPPRVSALEVSGLIAAEALILVDGWQTVYAARRPDQFWEHNMLLGTQPTSARIIGTVALAMTGVAVGWYVLPRPWNNLLTVAVGVAESAVVVRNFRVGAKLQF